MSGRGSQTDVPAGWKSMDDFAPGIDTNRLLATGRLAGTELTITVDGGAVTRLSFEDAHTVRWERGEATGRDWYEAIAVRDDVYFIDQSFTGRPRESAVLAVCTGTGWALEITSTIADAPVPGRPQVGQTFLPGHLGTAGPPAGPPPAPTRDLIGHRALYRYSPAHLYEHVYLNTERYAWQCLVGAQRGHGDVDLASTWKLGEGLYVFTFREFRIPVATTWLYDWPGRRSTGTFFGLASDGTVQKSPGGAFILPLGQVSYPDDGQPV